ncbi:PRC-barrel domain-containing protein [Amnibacterium kyonggiense]|uniref:PRC-barrel domain protein n=1 Tax=Amnibacterium kyonggiense TaxID=595671 RepID=A0A4V3EAF3_9MICO|nr:PRC-barrel domain-containing protein [Amnibacterium kyonggiense]TDS74824.1 PRC-barrel domain protein [Amnibacterium kyonggiense]
MITTDVIDSMIGADALDRQDDRIGEVGQVYVDEATERPTWVSVRLALLSGDEVLVPLEDAEWDERSLHVVVDRQAVREAPRKAMDEPLTVGEEERLYTYYGIPTERHPREENELLADDVDDVCYAVHDAAIEDAATSHSERSELSRAS